jgi:hypothetical protein
MMRLQHFGLKHSPLGKNNAELWDDGPYTQLAERFAWLLEEEVDAHRQRVFPPRGHAHDLYRSGA